jgi:hypothetical protein
MNQAIIDALQQLDHQNDEHWTSKGLPQVTVVANLSGVLTLTRAELNDLAPDFNREAARRGVAILSSPPSLAQPESFDEHTSEAPAASASPSSIPPAEDDRIVPTLAESRAMDREAQKELKLGELAHVREQIGAFRQREDQLVKELDEIVSQEIREQGPHANQIAIMDWIAGQLEERRQRAVRARELFAKGVEPHELAGRQAPIDAAMARASGYGNQRPKYPQWKPPR